MAKRKTPKNYISATQCGKYSMCPRLYKAIYYEGLEDESGYPALLGSILHVAARDISKKLMAGEDVSIEEDSRAAYMNALKSKELQEEHRHQGQVLPRDIQDGIVSLKEYAWKAQNDSELMLSIEGTMTIDYDDEIGLLIRPDRIDNDIDGGLHVIDLKNSQNTLSMDAILQDPQMNIYAYAAVEMMKEKHVPMIGHLKLSHYYFRYKKYKSVVVEPEDVMYIREYIDNVLEGIRSGKFPERINQYCHNCPRRAACGEYKKKYTASADPIKSAQAAHDELNEINAKAKLIDIRKKALRGYLYQLAERTGAVIVKDPEGEKKWWHKPQDERDWSNTLDILKLFKDHKVDALPETSISANSFYRLAKKLYADMTPEQVEEFKKQSELVAPMDTTTRFSCDKVTKDDKPKGKAKKKGHSRKKPAKKGA